MSERVDVLIQATEDHWKAGWDAGPTRLRWTSLPPQIGDPAPHAVLQDHEGVPTSLSALWSERPVLLLFWRHSAARAGWLARHV